MVPSVMLRTLASIPDVLLPVAEEMPGSHCSDDVVVVLSLQVDYL
jgi:hypothetical protein